ncbi:uncharacterized protein TRAVEDRAFT_66660 [Trametes versicolor FP-101664 SS1]|uniref:uncharacterized protein n=1 Tax=Trametes versicolor (strain FP-101664) TaxID=717944 RepID=UPI0004621D33|nr:uncharacterized protein TRAVEDRAFT_66660 [Trametes versicolor FP-101664 SS1]EIW53998.1 hypothetical protein TRAVEDRAFT_66660 [Trametes versicolor FP-101664 SS1]
MRGSSYATMAAAHAVWSCRELVDEILNHLAPLTKEDIKQTAKGFQSRLRLSRSQCMKTLARLCRTCKTLSEPATAVLWRRLNKLDPFMRLFSQVQKQMDAGRRSEKFVLHEAIPDAEWARFQHYAQHLRELYDGGDPRRHIYPRATWTQLGARADGRPLFPRLRCLWSLQVDSAGILELPLLSPSVRNLSVVIQDHTVHHEPELIQRALQTVRQTVLHLEHLSLKCDEGNAFRGLSTAASSFLTFKDVRSLVLDGNLTVDRAIFAGFCQFTALEHLSVTLYITDGERGPLDFGSFPSLRKACIRGPPDDLARFFAGVSLPALRKLSLDFSTDPAEAVLLASVASIFDAVPSGITHLEIKRLRRARWFVPRSDEERRPRPHTLMPIIKPAMRLRALARVSIDFTFVPSVTDADIARMLEAWPALTELAIHYGGRGDDDFELGRPTAATLLAVATRSPKLVSLTLPDTDLRNAGSVLPALPFPEHGLETLFLGSGIRIKRDEQFLRAALLIDRLFPYLRLPEDPMVYSEHYGELERYLKAMQAGRVHAAFADELEPGSCVEMYHLTPKHTYTIHERVGDGVIRETEPYSRNSTPDESIWDW